MQPLDLLRQLIRIRSITPSADGEAEVAEALASRLSDAGLRCRILTSPSGQPSLIARLDGPDDHPHWCCCRTPTLCRRRPSTGHDPFGAGILPRPVMPITLGEKASLVVQARVEADPSHASLLPLSQTIGELAGFVAKVSASSTPRVHPVMRKHFAVLARAPCWPTPSPRHGSRQVAR